MSTKQARVFVSVGTDVHPFHRLMDWLDAFDAADPARIRWTVQFGRSRQPKVEGSAFLDHDVMERAFNTASIVISHGGPSTIAEARNHGCKPLVVPRSPRLGEHVDGHQERFARRLAEKGLIWLAEDQQSFDARLRELLANPELSRLPVGDAQTSECASAASAAFGNLVASLFGAESTDTVTIPDAPTSPVPAGVPAGAIPAPQRPGVWFNLADIGRHAIVGRRTTREPATTRRDSVSS